MQHNIFNQPFNPLLWNNTKGENKLKKGNSGVWCPIFEISKNTLSSCMRRDRPGQSPRHFMLHSFKNGQQDVHLYGIQNACTSLPIRFPLNYFFPNLDATAHTAGAATSDCVIFLISPSTPTLSESTTCLSLRLGSSVTALSGADTTL